MKTWQKIKAQPELLAKYLVREKVIDTIRTFFKSQGFTEVFTPILVPTPSAEANLEVFETELRTSLGQKRRAFLIMSPEYAIKKLLAAGIGSCFEITRAFRNEEEVSCMHNPEFTILEWYRVGADYKKVMVDFEKLFVEIIKKCNGDVDLKKWIYQGEEYDLRLPWMKISVAEAFKKYVGIETETLLSRQKLLGVAREKGYQINSKTSWEQIFYQLFFNEIEPKLKESHKPVFIYDYPLAQAALARKKPEDPRFAERFEIFLAGLELGNCFSELKEAEEQKERLEADLALRKIEGKTKFPVDEDFIMALKSGLPEVAGIAVGVDRLVVLAANAKRIEETLFFPAGELFELEK